MSSSGDFMEDELIVRILKTPHFYRKGSLTSAAFRPQRGHAKLSTIRWLDREDPDAKVKARCASIGNSGSNHYWGVAALTAGDYLTENLGLEYTPEEYAGHTNVVFPAAVPHEEPLEGELFVRQSEIAAALIEKAKAIVDPSPSSSEWTIFDSALPLERR